MFGDSNGQQMKSLPVRVEMEGKRILTGNLVIPEIKSLNEVLNDSKQFIEFSTYEGSLQYISKKSIVHIESVEAPPSADQLKQGKNFNPYVILGIGLESGDIEIQQAYHRQAKIYHPDQFRNYDLPAEVMDYIISMSQRINIAYTDLCRKKHFDSVAREQTPAARAGNHYAI